MSRPVSYKDPYWRQLEESAGARYGVDPDYLTTIRMHGEKTNADRVSSAGAQTVWQIIPETRQGIIKRYGIDPYLSDQNAADAAALIYKEGLDRNGGDPVLAAGEYHGGPNRENWGPVNRAYRERVAIGLDEVRAMSARIDAAATGPLVPDQQTGLSQLPPGYSWQKPEQGDPNLLNADAPVQDEPAQPQDEQPAIELPPGYRWADEATQAQLTPGSLSGLSGVPGAIPQSSTPFGSDAPPPTRNAPDPRMPVAGQPYVPESYQHWRDMPELNQLSMAGAKTGIGSILAEDPAEAVQIVQANFPQVQARETEQGVVLTSPANGQEYVIPRTYTARDIPSTAAKLGAFVPSAMATSVGGSGAATALTDAALQGVKSWAGGRPVSGSQVAISGAIGGATPIIATWASRLIERLAPLLANPTTPLRSVPTATDDAARMAMDAPQAPTPVAPVSTPVAAAAPEQQWAPGYVPPPAPKPARAMAADVSRSRPAPAAAPQPAVPAAANVAAKVGDEITVNPDDLAELMRAAAEGDGKSAARLAELMRRDPVIVEAARALGLDEDSIPLDFFLMNRAAQEIVQMAKSQTGSALKEQERNALEQIGARAQKLLEELGGTNDLSELDASIRDRIVSVIDGLTEQAEKYYAKVRSAIPKATRVPAENIRAWLDAEIVDMGGVSKLGTREKELFRELKEDPTYGYLDKARKEVGAALGKRKTNRYSEMEDGTLAQLYSNLLKDQHAAAKSFGALGDYKKGSKLAKAYKEFQKLVTGMYGKDLAGSLLTKLETGVKALQGGDISKMKKLLDALPPEMREEAMASGLAAAFRGSFKKGDMSFSNFAKWFEGLERNKKAMDIVMAHLPAESRGQLVNLARLSRGIANSTEFYSTTGKSNQMAIRESLKQADTLLQNIVGLAKRSSIALVTEPIAQLFGMGGTGITVAVLNALQKGKPDVVRAIDTLTSSPEFLHLVKQIGKPGEAAAIKAVAKKSVFAQIFASRGEPKTPAQREQWLRDNLTGPKQ